MKNKSIIIATIKSWNIENAEKFKNNYNDYNVLIICDKQKLNEEYINTINPEYIFFPHWSWNIPKEVYSKYECIVFHETDLPFGRGGSPIQNLLEHGIYNTKITAIKAVEELDAGPIYCKENLDISEGSIEDILRKSSRTIFSKMIPNILNNRIIPREQKGEVVFFNRRTPDQSRIPYGLSNRQLYDYIRMLDGEGYPTAYQCYEGGKIYYSNAKYENGVLTAKAEFIENRD